LAHGGDESFAWSGQNDPVRMRRVILRPANTADGEAIAVILNALLATTAIEWTDTPHTADSILEWLSEHETVLVAEEGAEVIGVAAFGWFRDVIRRPGYRFTVENTVHVREDRWGSGVGRELMEALIDEARRGGKHTMVAAVDGANEASIGFHQRLGFVEVARMPEIGAKFGRWQDLILLQLHLDDRSEPWPR
jgi:L-amino acid N-acyltransferase YncA